MKFINLILNLGTKKRLMIMIFIDAILFWLSINLSGYLQINQDINFLGSRDFNILRMIFIPIGLSFFFLSGQYRGLTRFVGSVSLYKLVLRKRTEL